MGGDARGRRYGDICICIADSLCDTAETNHTIVKQLYSNKDVGKKKKNPIQPLKSAPPQHYKCVGFPWEMFSVPAILFWGCFPSLLIGVYASSIN